MSTVELVSAESPHAAPQVAARPLVQSDRTLIAACVLLICDTLLLVLAGAPLLPVVLTIALYAAANLYPGFGMMTPERLRRRWLLGIPLLVLCGFHSLGALIAAGLYLLLSPLAEALTRHLLMRFAYWGKPAEVSGDAARILQQNPQLGLIPAGQADTLVILNGSKPEPVQSSRAREVWLLEEGGICRRIRPQEAGWLSRWVGALQIRQPVAWPWFALKRAMDIVGSIALLLLTLPVLVLAMLAICLIDPGPVIFTQQRRGQHGVPIRIYKLRSMYQDSAARLEKLLSTDAVAAGSWKSRFKLQPDPRVLPLVGAIIRTFSIDELPQLFNVLKGEMSLVGPRVFLDYDLEVYPPALLQLRQSVPSGLTGLWQVSVRSDGDNADKVRYDAAYVGNWSIWQDMDILYRTVGAVLTGRGAS